MFSIEYRPSCSFFLKKIARRFYTCQGEIAGSQEAKGIAALKKFPKNDKIQQ